MQGSRKQTYYLFWPNIVVLVVNIEYLLFDNILCSKLIILHYMYMIKIERTFKATFMIKNWTMINKVYKSTTKLNWSAEFHIYIYIQVKVTLHMNM